MLKIPMMVERSVEIERPVDEVYHYLANFANWRAWSPWLCQEPSCPVTIKGEPGTVGHGQAWDGKVIGAGEMSITRTVVPSTIEYDLTFLKPWKSKSQVSFRVEGTSAGSKVTWTMDGNLPIFLFFMKKMMVNFVINDYERGLNMLKEAIENGSAPTRVETRGETECQAFHWVGKPRSCALADMPEQMKADLDELAKALKEGRLKPPKFVLCLYTKWDMQNGRSEFTAAYAYDDPTTANEFSSGSVPAHRAFRVDHIGAYRFLGNAWGAAMSQQRSLKLKTSKSIDMYEVYESDPQTTDEKDIVTAIHLPLR